MPIHLTDLKALADLPFDQVIDVRSPTEFAQDHIPGAINLPVLSDAERAEVGTIYVQKDRFLARKVGAALVARNSARHIEGPLADRDGGWRPLVYCWRGGQRSGSFASILQQIGWRVGLVEGGYKSYRRLVVDALYDRPLDLRIVLLAGGTGTAKTRILHHLKAAGAQMLDLEGLANHRGSLFGGMGDPQPSQKMFESRLATAITTLDPARPVIVEAESNKIGDLLIPPSLWSLMNAAPQVEITAPLAARGRYLITAYADLLDDADLLARRIDKLAPYHAKAQVEAWHAMAGRRAFEALARDLAEQHYDPRYAKSTLERRDVAARIDMQELTDAEMVAVAPRIIAAAERAAG
ncbi:tRNA 2-selenouridine(34) synthase MnmH [Sulfitobacter sabulilitoris]|uniref:tRNA 2-selenouridine(34) synthase MnmH n=1 Tax=Sulfitobacter sabulilitoris TaxID=2562655 RepID=A0A5S3PI64_9RHOB|nr:tRNA 2-selenouridine(34) synthase MnmH [Sulfitobacter sabulilitoris]TMM54043.1 tRNA 2-selenouridine(34) synthase MnmH [Sulfitobacter sabulilitoris]